MAAKNSTIITVYSLFFISALCSLTVTLKLCTSEKNYLIAVLAAGMALCELTILSSIIWIYDFKNLVPGRFCVFQGIAIQYFAYLQIVTALCFSFHLYHLLVKRKDRMLQRVYNYSIAIIPVIMTGITAIISVEARAIQPFVLSCDIKKPVWVRLFGYSGFNLILSFIGIYFSVRAAYEVFNHLDRFKSQMTSSNVDNTTNDEENTVKRSYDMTKIAALRMVLFSCGFALVNIGASVNTLLVIVNGGRDDEDDGLRSADYVASVTGIMIYLIFGLPSYFEKKLLKYV